MNKAEYWILRRAVKHYECLRDVAYECGLNQAEVAAAANRLFQNGDIKARVATHDEDFEAPPNAYLTMSEIQACLDGKLRAYYALTPQGGNRWETVAHADWNRYFEFAAIAHQLYNRMESARSRYQPAFTSLAERDAAVCFRMRENLEF